MSANHPLTALLKQDTYRLSDPATHPSDTKHRKIHIQCQRNIPWPHILSSLLTYYQAQVQSIRADRDCKVHVSPIVPWPHHMILTPFEDNRFHQNKPWKSRKWKTHVSQSFPDRIVQSSLTGYPAPFHSIRATSEGNLQKHVSQTFPDRIVEARYLHTIQHHRQSIQAIKKFRNNR